MLIDEIYYFRGRKNSHIYAACVYITCRTEGTSRKSSNQFSRTLTVKIPKF